MGNVRLYRVLRNAITCIYIDCSKEIQFGTKKNIFGLFLISISCEQIVPQFCTIWATEREVFMDVLQNYFSEPKSKHGGGGAGVVFAVRLGRKMFFMYVLWIVAFAMS